MRVFSDLVLRPVPQRSRTRRLRGATAIMLAIGVAWITIQPAPATHAQQSGAPQQSSDEKPAKASKKRTKKAQKKDSTVESSTPIILPQIFSNRTGPSAGSQAGKSEAPGKPVEVTAGKQFKPQSRSLTVAGPINVKEAAARQELRSENEAEELKDIDAPQPPPGRAASTIPILKPSGKTAVAVSAPTPSSTGISPGPTKTFLGEFLSGTTIPPDTMGAVGTTHVVTVSNDRIRFQDRNGVQLSRMTLNSFWSGATVKGSAVTSAFDTKVFFDRFNSRFILVSSLNGPGQFSGMGLAVTQTADPTGTWNRFTAASDPASTPGSGHAIDYPSVGFNKNWIVVDENTFNYSGSSFTTYYGQQIFVFDKAAAYANTLSSFALFEGQASTCTGVGDATNLGCGFTMAPAITEDNTTDTEYLVEDWDSTAAQLRLSKITGTPSAPVITIGTQFPQSTLSWRFNASRIDNSTTATTNGTTITSSGGYVPQHQQSAHLVSSTRVAGNDSRIQNAVFRGGSLWTVHHVMLASTPTLAGTSVGGTGNPDNHAAVQWWQIDPTIETGLAQAPLQRARIEDASADNCHNGIAGTSLIAPCTSTGVQHGTFFTFPNISVNLNNDVIIGFTQSSALTYPSGAYAIRRSTDPVNTMRDPVVFRPGQANYNIGSGSSTSTYPTRPTRNNRWGDYSGSQTDPLDDTNFWVIQEYGGTQRNDFLAPSYAGPWETWWAQVNPAASQPSTSGNLIISEFRLRGPQGVRDEYVELYNPAATPVYVSTTDNSDGWALVYSPNGAAMTGVAVIPNGTVIPAKGHFLITDNPDNAGGGASTQTYSLNSSAATPVRTANSDVGYAFDNADNGGFAIFKSSLPTGWTAGNRMDAVGFSSIAAGLFKEGNGLPAISTATPVGQYAFYRDLSGGEPKDTGVNENDFVFIDSALETFGSTPRLGAAGPENLDSPIQRNATIGVSFIDPGCTVQGPLTSACAKARDFTAAPPIGPLGTFAVRRRFTNNTGAAITKLRFRIVDVTTLNSPGYGAGQADLRPISGPLIPAANLSGGGTTDIQGLTLEEPPTQSNGGGFNSSLAAGVITLSAPLAPAASVNIELRMGVQQAGHYRIFINIEALP